MTDLKTEYPSRYYAQYTVDRVVNGIDVWNGVDYKGNSVDTSNLPHMLFPLTENQYALLTGSSYVPVHLGALAFPDRYYAYYDTTAAQPAVVLGWYDTWDMTDVTNVPDVTKMIVVTASDWENVDYRTHCAKAVLNGKIIDYTVPVPLASLAASALAAGRDYCTQNYLLYNESIPDDWVTYMKALNAIASGTDTLSVSLPTSPLDPSDVKTPAELLKDKLASLGALLVTKQESGFYFTPTGATSPVLFSTSVKAQTQYEAANTLAKANPSTSQDFIELSGAPITLTGADTIALTTKVAQYVSDCYTVYTKMFDAIASGQTVDTSTGWPANS